MRSARSARPPSRAATARIHIAQRLPARRQACPPHQVLLRVIKAVAGMGVPRLGNAIHPGIVREHLIDDPAADEGNHTAGDARIGLARREWALYHQRGHDRVYGDASGGGYEIGKFRRGDSRRRRAVPSREPVGSGIAGKADADAGRCQARVLLAEKNVQDRITFSASNVTVQPDRQGKGHHPAKMTKQFQTSAPCRQRKHCRSPQEPKWGRPI